MLSNARALKILYPLSGGFSPPTAAGTKVTPITGQGYRGNVEFEPFCSDFQDTRGDADRISHFLSSVDPPPVGM